MPSTATDRLFGLTTSVAVKAPCRTVATTNITLAGLQTINGVTVAEGDRVLAKGQTTGSENGIYVASTGTWSRAADFDGNRDVVRGTLVPIAGTGNSADFYEVITSGPLTIGTTSIAFALRYGANVHYDRSETEIAAGVTPVNYAYPPGEVDRYGTNTNPGNTPMAAAFNAAVKVAKQTGCSVVWGRTAPYRLEAPIDATQCRGIVFDDRSSKNASDDNVSLIIAHSGFGFDIASSTEHTFNNVTATTLSGVVPKALWFAARNAARSGCGFHRFYNCRTGAHPTFSFIYYGYGSEENVFDSCVFYNEQPGSAIFSHNTNNPSGYTSTFVTISSAPDESNVCHRHTNGQYFNLGNSGSHNEVVFDLYGASDFSYIGGLWACKGLAYIRVGGAGLALNAVAVRDVRAEAIGVQPSYGVAVVTTGTTGVASHVNWIFENVGSNASGHFIRFDDAAEIQRLALRNIIPTSGFLLNAYSISESLIVHYTGIVDCRAGGVATKNTFIGTRSSITLSGTDTLNTGFDQGNGEAWSTGDRYTAASTACTGALTVASTYKIVKTGQQVTITLLATTGTATATTNFAFGVAIPAAYRPSANIRMPCVIQDNGAVVNQPGFVLVTASTGVISVFKDIVGTANFTAAAVAGIPADTGLCWRL